MVNLVVVSSLPFLFSWYWLCRLERSVFMFRSKKAKLKEDLGGKAEVKATIYKSKNEKFHA